MRDVDPIFATAHRELVESKLSEGIGQGGSDRA
jgi:hypothetical protein